VNNTYENLWKKILQNAHTAWLNPDMAAMRIVLTVAASHYFFREAAIWLLVVGAPSSGKTEIAIRGVSKLDKTHWTGKLTRNTFLSGRDKDSKPGTKKASMLLRVGESVIILIPDFSSILALHPAEQQDLMAQFRELFDRHCTKETGMGVTLEWLGKCTVIAAATGAIENSWAESMRNLGDRFLTVRWPSCQDAGIAAKIYDRSGKQAELEITHQTLIRDFIHRDKRKRASLTRDQQLELFHTASLLSWSRIPAFHVYSRAEVSNTGDREDPGRILTSLMQAARVHAGLFGRQKVSQEDMQIARRLAWDSIPLRRRKMIQAIGMYPGALSSLRNLQDDLKISSFILKYTIEELEATGVTCVPNGTVVPCAELSPKYLKTLRLAFPNQVGV